MKKKIWITRYEFIVVAPILFIGLMFFQAPFAQLIVGYTHYGCEDYQKINYLQGEIRNVYECDYSGFSSYKTDYYTEPVVMGSSYTMMMSFFVLFMIGMTLPTKRSKK